MVVVLSREEEPGEKSELLLLIIIDIWRRRFAPWTRMTFPLRFKTIGDKRQPRLGNVKAVTVTMRIVGGRLCCISLLEHPPSCSNNSKKKK